MIIVTLGCQPRSNANVDQLCGRVDVSLERFHQTGAEYLLFTGGVTHPREQRSECELMRAHAVNAGINPDRILLEDRALDTIGNGYYSRLLVEDLQRTVKGITLITSDYHLERASYIFEQCYGPDYDILPVAYESVHLEASRHEAHSYRQARSFFEGITPGDIDSIGQHLMESHEYYDDSYIVSTAVD